MFLLCRGLVCSLQLLHILHVVVPDHVERIGSFAYYSIGCVCLEGMCLFSWCHNVVFFVIVSNLLV